MKQLLKLISLTIITVTFVPKCYKCDEIHEDQSCKDPITQTCSSDQSQIYCGTIPLLAKQDKLEKIAKPCLPREYDFLSSTNVLDDCVTKVKYNRNTKDITYIENIKILLIIFKFK